MTLEKRGERGPKDVRHQTKNVPERREIPNRSEREHENPEAHIVYLKPEQLEEVVRKAQDEK